MFDHDTLVWFSKSFGLLYLIALFLITLAYAYWPSNRTTFDHAARAILTDEDEPWR
jgi:cytochrome c oxidase cbb3-type subunit 4